MRLTLIRCLVLFALASTAVPAQPSARRSGNRILFDSDRDGNSEIYVMDPDGSHQQRLTHTPGKGKNSWGARWSPDRRKIVFASTRDGNQEIFVMDADGSNVCRLTQTADESTMKLNRAQPDQGSMNPAWSPNGKRIVFDSKRDGKWEIYVMEADGSSVRRLTQTPGEGTGSGNPDWSPDGKKIAFVSGPKGWMEDEIYVIDADGSHVQRLTNTPGRHNWTPRWSPDGKRIVFSSNRSDPKNEDKGEIYVMNADASDVRQLTRYGLGAFRPDWSPDGKRIVFMSSHHARSTDYKHDQEIYVMDADGTNVWRLTFNRYFDAHHAW